MTHRGASGRAISFNSMPHRWSLPYLPSEVCHLVSVSVVCSLNSNCRVHAQVLSSHRGRLLPFHGWVSGESDPSACLCNSRCTYGFSAQGHPGLLLLRRRLARRQPQWCTTSGGLKNTEQAKRPVHILFKPQTTESLGFLSTVHIGVSRGPQAL